MLGLNNGNLTGRSPKAQDRIERRRIAMNSSRALQIALHIDGG
jgi:hypothetical protein